MREKSSYLIYLVCAGMLAGCSNPQMAGGAPEPYDPDRANCLWYGALDSLLYGATGAHFFLTPSQVAERKVMLDPCAQYASSMRQWRTYEENQ